MQKIKVKQFYNKNQFVIKTEDEGVYFQSYDSLIANYHHGLLTLGCNWDYSNTTRKHLYLFLYDYCYYIYEKISNEANKRKALQKLIDEGVVLYDGGLY